MHEKSGLCFQNISKKAETIITSIYFTEILRASTLTNLVITRPQKL